VIRARGGAAVAALAALSATACAAGAREGARVERPTYADTAQPDCRDTALRVDVVDEQPGTPVSYVFDLTLRNPAASPRWLVLPRSFPRDGKEGPAPGTGPVATLEADVLAGRGRATLVRAAGPGGFQAVFLPGGAVVHLREVAIEAPWDTSHAIAKFPIIVARDFTIDDRSASAWFPSHVTTDADADVNAAATPRDHLASGIRRGEHTAAFTEDCRATAQAILKGHRS